jgi:hypothetical protein
MYFRKYQENIIYRNANTVATIADIFDGNDELKFIYLVLLLKIRLGGRAGMRSDETECRR